MFKNMTTSKWLTYIITFAYIIQVGAISCIRTKYGIDLSPLLNYTTPLEFTIVCAYFGKSSYENNIKIKGDIDKSLQTMSQPMEISQSLLNNPSIQPTVSTINSVISNQPQQMFYTDTSDIYMNH